MIDPNAREPSPATSHGPLAPVAAILPRLETLEVRFGPPDSGWIELHTPQFSPRRTIMCSETHDPFPDFHGWLDAIARGESAIWRIGEEGSDSTFVYLSRQWIGEGTAQLLYSWGAAGSVRQLTGGVVQPRLVVAAFYDAFQSMIAQPEYRERDWEGPPFVRGSPVDDPDDDSYDTHPFSGARLREFDWSKVEAFLSRNERPDAFFSND